MRFLGSFPSSISRFKVAWARNSLSAQPAEAYQAAVPPPSSNTRSAHRTPPRRCLVEVTTIPTSPSAATRNTLLPSPSPHQNRVRRRSTPSKEEPGTDPASADGTTSRSARPRATGRRPTPLPHLPPATAPRQKSAGSTSRPSPPFLPGSPRTTTGRDGDPSYARPWRRGVGSCCCSGRGVGGRWARRASWCSWVSGAGAAASGQS